MTCYRVDVCAHKFPCLALPAPVVEQSEEIERGNTHLILQIMLGMEIDLLFLVVPRFKDDSAQTFP